MRKLVLGIAFTSLAIVAGAVRADDMQTAQEIANQLYKSGKFNGRPIAVKYQDGTVWVKGQLADSKQEESALSMLYGRSDVKNVVNLLTVDGKSEAGSKPAPATAASAQSDTSESADESADSSSSEGTDGNSASNSEPKTSAANDGSTIASRLARVFSGGRTAKTEEPSANTRPASRSSDNRLTETTPVRAQAAVANEDSEDDIADAVPPESFVERPEARRPVKRPAVQPREEARRTQYSIPQAQSRAPSKKPIARTASRQGQPGQVPGRDQVAYRQPGQLPGGPQGRPAAYNPNGMPGNGGPVPMHVMGGPGPGAAPISYDQPHLPNYAWPSYAAYPNYAGVSYPKQYSPTAWPYIGPFYPYPQVPLGWRRVTLEWDDGWWWLDFDDGRKGYGCGHCTR